MAKAGGIAGFFSRFFGGPEEVKLVSGAILGSRYLLIEEIGKGGSATVYRARDQLLEHEVALKILHLDGFEDLGARELLANLRSEASLAMSLSHRNITRVFTYESMQGLELLVMEYVHGANLSRVRAQRVNKRLTSEEVSALGVAALDALLYAHDRGIVHNDIKPGNFILTPKGVLKLCDFGLARLSDAGSRKGTLAAGTVPFMSPERIRGAQGNVLSDIFAIGATLWYLGHGSPPYGRKLKEVVDRFKDPLEASPHIEAGLDWVLRRALSLKPERRWQSAREMQAALMHCCRVDPEQDGTPTVMDTVEAVIEAGRAEGFHPERGEDTLRYSAPGVEVVDENLMVLADEHTLEIDRARLAAYLQDQASKGKGMVTPPPAPAAVAFGLGPAALGDGQLRQAELPAPPVMAPPMVEAPAPPPVMAPAPISVDTPPPLLSAAAAGVVATASAVSPGQATTPAPEAVRAAPTPTLPIPRRLSLPPDMAEIPPISVDGAAVRAFYMDRTLVTNQLYRDFLVATEYPPPQLWYGVRFPEGQGNHPVTGVSLEAARAFAKWRGRRLPTVSEWIAAATGGMRTNPWGDREIAGRCNCKQSGLDRTTPVGQFPQGDSPQGVSDLWGNVWEWVDSEIEEDRVLVLGGSFKHPCSEVDVPRTRISPEKEYTYLGFRCALSPDVP